MHDAPLMIAVRQHPTATLSAIRAGPGSGETCRTMGMTSDIDLHCHVRLFPAFARLHTPWVNGPDWGRGRQSALEQAIRVKLRVIPDD
eukprot:CAMPEP_0203845980 /NCGR_PEP_ID=MMETSP0359-20131031/4152_1 /ASSEMBLY_ACC=CAM_ASM_000338 /TAXON_ID=268821 /ORGANISM="Scrippsiella Hangoei, Strain SHTV-5" /LENGTH=87 /DNA_ID=CAMNT_0050761227 /DNA_START=773 /DNA_END=1036 /DNA_ORIENTATION=-